VYQYAHCVSLLSLIILTITITIITITIITITTSLTFRELLSGVLCESVTVLAWCEYDGVSMV
jgi:hypothetical protein